MLSLAGRSVDTPEAPATDDVVDMAELGREGAGEV